jgi:hypothetical protein
MIFSRNWLLAALLSLCAPAIYAQSLPQLVGKIDIVPGKDFTHAKRFTIDPANGNALVLGSDDDGAGLKLVEHAKPGPTGDQPTGSAEPEDNTRTLPDAAIDHTANRYYVLGTNSIVGYVFGSSTPVLTIPLGLPANSEARQMALDLTRQRIYVSTEGGHALSDTEPRGAVLVVDLAQKKVIATIVLHIFNPAELVVDESHNKVYVFNRGSFYFTDTEQSIGVINGSGFGVKSIAVPVPESYPFLNTQRQLAFNPTAGKVYAIVDRDVLNPEDDFSRIAVISTSDDTLLKQIDLLAGDNPRHASFIAASPGTARVYLSTQEENNAVQVLDTTTDALIEPLTVPAGGDFMDLTVGPGDQELQVLTSDSVLRTPLDGSGNYAQIWLAASPWMTAVNPATHKLYVMDSHRFTLFVLSTATGELVKAILLTTPDGHVVNPLGLAVNTETNRVYVTVNDSAAPDSGLLCVYDGADESLLKSYPVYVVDPNRQDPTPMTWGPAEMIVDAPNHRLFVRQSYYISIVDTETDTVDQTPIGTLPEYGDIPLMRIAYDPGLNYLFALSQNLENAVVVAVYDVSTKQQVATIGDDARFTSDGSAIGQSDLVLNPDTSRLYVAGHLGGDDSFGNYDIFGFDTTTGSVTESYDSPVAADGDQPSFDQARLTLNRAQNRIYVTTQPGFNGPKLMLIRPVAHSIQAVADVGVLPSLAFSETDQRLYISEQSDAVKYDRLNNGETQVFADPATPGTLQFSLAKYTVSEAGGAATIAVKRSGGDYGAVSVQYATADGSATAGQDYTTASGTLSWAAGDTADKTFTVPVLNDSQLEGPEVLQLTLSSPTGGATLGTLAQAQLAITDDEVASPNAPRITSALTASAEVARPFTYRIVATKTPKSFEALNLPAGLTVTATGIIRGTPTAAGTSYVTLKATNNFGTGIATLTLTVNPETRPELSGAITTLKIVQAANGALVVSGFGKISNTGTRAAINTRSQIYISDNATFDAGVDKPLQAYVAVTTVPAQFRGAALPSLARGVSFGPRAFKFTIPAGKAAQLTGKYLVFVVDTTNRALEFDETNNVSSAGPIVATQ